MCPPSQRDNSQKSIYESVLYHVLGVFLELLVSIQDVVLAIKKDTAKVVGPKKPIDFYF